jgi:hypothetical protein
MSKMIKLLVVVVLLGAAAYFYLNRPSSVVSERSGAPAVRPEEKVGVTTETVGQ